MSKVIKTITNHRTIYNDIKNYKNIYQVLSEYIWNGFDAGATIVSVNYSDNGIAGIGTLVITDNGNGINYETLSQTFQAYRDSRKQQEESYAPKLKNHTKRFYYKEQEFPFQITPITHGKKGMGRYAFARFFHDIEWESCYQGLQFTIKLNSETLDNIIYSEPTYTNNLGTKVSFFNPNESHVISDDMLVSHLQVEFGWFLALNSEFKLLVNKEEVDYKKNIKDNEKFEYSQFNIQYIQWEKRFSDQYSYFYFLDEKRKPQFKVTTRLNNKGDEFYHSVIINGDIFNNFSFSQSKKFIKHNETVIYELLSHLEHYLRSKRYPALEIVAMGYVAQLEDDGILPNYNPLNSWEELRQNNLRGLLKEIYQFEPRIFSNLNKEQKKTMVYLFNLIMDNNQLDNLSIILESIITLSEEEKKNLAHILKKNKLGGIINTIKMIEDRRQSVELLKKLIFMPEEGVKEKEIQEKIEQCSWLIGEEYHLLAAEEVNFQKLLRELRLKVYGEETYEIVDKPYRHKQVDVFIVRTSLITNRINCVIIELKRPAIIIGRKELEQIKIYMDAVISTPSFRNHKFATTWDFFLIGKGYKDEIKREMENVKEKGKPSLVFGIENYNIYVKTWDEIFEEFRIRHNFLLKHLESERDSLGGEIVPPNTGISPNEDSFDELDTSVFGNPF